MIHSVSVIILAAGRSERMGAANKLLLPLGGRPLLEHALHTAVQAAPLEVIVVTGYDEENVERVVRKHEAIVIHNPQFQEGMASTIRSGIAAASGEGYAIFLADLPFVRLQTIRLLGEHASPDRIVVPTYEGERGHPVIFGRAFREELLALRGDVGARAVIQAHRDALLLIKTSDPGTVRDVNTRDDYNRHI